MKKIGYPIRAFGSPFEAKPALKIKAVENFQS
jgi:hypothetical protein